VSVVGQVLIVLLWIFFLLLIFRLVMDYVFLFARSYQPRGPVLVALEATYTVTDPPLRALRRVIPPLRLGSISLDLSFLVLIIIVQILVRVVVPAIFL
jgi:YggT family protein